MLGEQMQRENPAMDLLNHIDESVSLYDYDLIRFETNESVITVNPDEIIGVVNYDKQFIEVKKENQIHLINMNQLVQVVVKYANNNPGI